MSEMEEIMRCISLFSSLPDLIRYSPNRRILTEMTIIRACRAAMDDGAEGGGILPLEKIKTRIREMEMQLYNNETAIDALMKGGAVGGYQPIGMAPTGSDATPTFIGGDRTMIDDLNAGAKYLELLDTQYSDCPREISLDFNKPYLLVGRRSNDPVQPDVAFPDQYKGVSRQHARITKAPDGTISVTDLGSTYGTAINGQKLVPNAVYPLTDGAVLTFVESKPIRYRVHL